MAINSGEHIQATVINAALKSKLNCVQYNILPHDTLTLKIYSSLLIVFCNIFSDSAVAMIRNEFTEAGDQSFLHTIKAGTVLDISTSKCELKITNNSTVGGSAIILYGYQ